MENQIGFIGYRTAMEKLIIWTFKNAIVVRLNQETILREK
jgi:hypothetical protein